MTITGNQYADKVFSEHPIALWPLDEHVYYLSLIDDNARLFSNWTLTNCTYSDTPTLPEVSSPFPDSVNSSITANTSSPVTIEAESQGLFSFSEINSGINTFSINIFLYQNPTYINWIKVGYRYLDAFSNPQEIISDEIIPPSTESWLNINNVYQVPTSWSGDMSIFIQANFSDSSGGDESSRTLILNGLSIGQNSETTAYESLGSIASYLPDSTGLSTIQGISADQYGVLSDNGYYIVRNNSLLAKNDGFPMVFGTEQSTKIYPSGTSVPSFIFPGKGMLNENGRNKNYTLEMWIKLDPSTSIAKKIIGPLSTSDGIYVKEGFITLAIGSEIASHCVSEWYRPMLVHLTLRETNAVLMINGESVIDIPLNRITIDLPNDTDWWGVYSYSEISMFQLDCISIYPYIVSELVAKRRFVYGQGTPSIQSVDDSFFGTPTTIDFSTAQYGPNIVYPDVYRWDAGYFNNLNANKNYLSTPNYQLPTINIGGRDIDRWYEDNYQVNTLEYEPGTHPNFITFRPNIEYDNDGQPSFWNNAGNNYVEQCYFNFPSLNILNDAISSIYGVFEIEDDLLEQRTLMSFVNITNSDTFDIIIESNVVKYLYNGQELQNSNGVFSNRTITLGTEIAIGLNFERAGASFGYNISRFFSSPSSIQLYVGGNGSNTFEGKIYSIGFSNQQNYSLISENFDSDGIAISSNYEILINHVASYTLIPEYQYGKMFLDISVSSEWEEYYPLSFFAGYVKDSDGNLTYDLDSMQLNVGYSYVETEGVWIYSELINSFSGQTYADLPSSYTNYFALFKNNTTGNTTNVSNSSLQSYVTFQRISDGANAPLSSFNNIKQLPIDNIIYADQENTVDFPYRVYDTKFVVTDNTVIYPPKTNNFEDYAMVVHFEITQRAILKNPLKIRSMEIASKNFNYVSNSSDESQRNIIGTKFGTNVYPQIIDGGVVDYKSSNPIFIYKTGTPYLYTSKKSGIRVGTNTPMSASPAIEYMSSIPVNSGGAYDFYIGAIQFFVKGEFSSDIEETKLMDINHKGGKISLSIDKTETGNFIRAYDNDGTTLVESSNISFYQNGRYVLNPTIINNEWNAIGISFIDELDYSEYLNGSIDLYGGAVFNNISYYLSQGLGIKTDLTIRNWENVLNYDSVTRAWSFWDAGSQLWRDVYILGQSTSYFSTPQDIYRSYTGTNKSIVDDGYGIRMNTTQSLLFTQVNWSTLTEKPV